jgi:hypothetical protein
VPAVPAEYYGDHPAWPGDVAQEPGPNGTQSLGALLVVPQAQAKAVTFTFGLPRAVLTGEGKDRVYRLRVQKQPGIESINVEINVIPPAGMSPVAAQPEGWVTAPDARLVTWKGVLRASTNFELKFVPMGQ